MKCSYCTENSIENVVDFSSFPFKDVYLCKKHSEENRKSLMELNK